MGVDENRARAAIGRDTSGWEGVVGDEVDDFAGAGVEEAAAAGKASALGCGERDCWYGGFKGRERSWEGHVFQLDGREVCLESGRGFRRACAVMGRRRHDCFEDEGLGHRLMSLFSKQLDFNSCPDLWMT